MNLKEIYPIQALVVSQLLRKRRLLLMLPRQEGKTEIGIRIIHDMLSTDNTVQALFLAKSKTAAKKASREKFNRIFPKEFWRVNTQNVINRKNPNAICFIDSVDKEPDRMRGGTYNFIHWSEVAFSKFEHGVTHDDVINKILIPTFRKTNGFFLLESTSNGENGWKEMWDSAESFGASTLKVSLSMLLEMGLVSRFDYDKIKAETHPLVFLQEFECEFVKFAGKIYSEFEPDFMVQEFDIPYSLDTVGVAIDWGFIDATCMLAAFIYDNTIWIFDEIYVKKTLLEEFAVSLHDKIVIWNCKKYVAVADHEPDRIAELHKRKIACSNADKSNVLGVRLQIKELFWRDKIRIHPRCRYLIKDLSAMSWDKNKESKREDADYSECTWGHYDAEAAFRYLIRNLSNIAETEKMQLDFSLERRA